MLQQPPPLQATQQPPLQRDTVNLQQQPPPLQKKVVPLLTLKMQIVLVPPTVANSLKQPVNLRPEAHVVETASPETTCEFVKVSVPEIEVSSVEC